MTLTLTLILTLKVWTSQSPGLLEDGYCLCNNCLIRPPCSGHNTLPLTALPTYYGSSLLSNIFSINKLVRTTAHLLKVIFVVLL